MCLHHHVYPIRIQNPRKRAYTHTSTAHPPSLPHPKYFLALASSLLQSQKLTLPSHSRKKKLLPPSLPRRHVHPRLQSAGTVQSGNGGGEIFKTLKSRVKTTRAKKNRQRAGGGAFVRLSLSLFRSRHKVDVDSPSRVEHSGGQERVSDSASAPRLAHIARGKPPHTALCIHIYMAHIKSELRLLSRGPFADARRQVYMYGWSAKREKERKSTRGRRAEEQKSRRRLTALRSLALDVETLMCKGYF